MLGKCEQKPPSCREEAQGNKTERLSLCEFLTDEFEKNLCVVGAGLFHKQEEA
jgi:hypothetical protein